MTWRFWYSGAPALIAALALAGCVLHLGEPSVPSGPLEITSAELHGLKATLEDRVRDLPGGRIAWNTYWHLCWDAYPGASGYELAVNTGEGASPKLRQLHDRCFHLEVAAGENERSLSLYNRKALLAMQAGQLAYRVRVVLPGNRAGQWSTPFVAGTES